MRTLLIMCEVFHRELLAAVAASEHQIDVRELPKGLHDRGGKTMAAALQLEIDKADPAVHGQVVLGYALCNNGLIGLRAPGVPLVAMRAHDCIACLLGSRQRYDQEFAAAPGTYWLSIGWQERGGANSVLTGPGTGVPRDENPEYLRLLKKYGDENAAFLWSELQEQTRHYERLAYIDTGIGPQAAAIADAQSKAADKGWRFERMLGDPAWLNTLVNGPWEGDDLFLVVPPGQSIAARYDGSLIGLAG